MIRDFTLSDMDSILKIEKESFPKSPYSKSVFLDLHRNENVVLLVCVRDGEIVGDMVFGKNGHAVTLAVAAKHRRKGIAAALMKKSLELISGSFLYFEVRTSNQTAKEFYRHLGGVKVSDEKGYYTSPAENAEIWIIPKSGGK